MSPSPPIGALTPNECGDTIDSIDPECNLAANDGGFTGGCNYCVHPPQEVPCSIEHTEHDEVCGANAGSGRTGVWLAGGVLIAPNTPDIYGDMNLFLANDGLRGRVNYYLKRLAGRVYPEYQGNTEDCCYWLCHWTVHNQPAFSWELHCNRPIQYPSAQQGSQRIPRPFFVDPNNHPTFVHFAVGGKAHSCFQLIDQWCMSGGPDTGTCGVTDEGGVAPCWTHLAEGEARLTVLDSIGVDLNMRIATDSSRYPHKEPECVWIANDALKQVGEYVLGLTSPGHSRLNSYNQARLNRWTHTQGFGPCVEAPAVNRGGTKGGIPWTIYVEPWGSSCRFPAELVFRRAIFTLFVSGDPGGFNNPESPRTCCPDEPHHLNQMRIFATFSCRLELAPRLRPGWEEIGCSYRFVNEDPCELTFIDPLRYTIVASDGCTRIPTVITWRGLLGPQPWSRVETPYIPNARNLNTCCSFLHALHETVIPGEVNDAANPSGSQRFDGDVILFLNVEPRTIC